MLRKPRLKPLQGVSRTHAVHGGHIGGGCAVTNDARDRLRERRSVSPAPATAVADVVWRCFRDTGSCDDGNGYGEQECPGAGKHQRHATLATAGSCMGRRRP